MSRRLLHYLDWQSLCPICNGSSPKIVLPELPRIRIDKQRVLQILVNLITNATHALSRSEKQEKVLTIRGRKDNDNKLRIDVVDNRIGIPKENVSKIFQHGFTTRKDGHGFGLHGGALAAQEIGGSLTVHSEGSGHGATLTLELLLKAEEATARA